MKEAVASRQQAAIRKEEKTLLELEARLIR